MRRRASFGGIVPGTLADRGGRLPGDDGGAALRGADVGLPQGGVLLQRLVAGARGVEGGAHGAEAEGQMSSYYVADEMSMTWRGMVLVVPDEQWQPYRQAEARALAGLLLGLARQVDPLKYKKHKSSPTRKPRKTRPKAPRKHSATARLLEPDRFGRKKPP